MLKKALAAILIIVLLVAAGFFYKDYRDQTSAADILKTQIKNEAAQATTVTIKNQALQAEIDQINSDAKKAQLDIVAANQLVPTKENSNRILESILILGSQKAVTVIPLSTQEWATTKVGQHNYQVFKMNIEVTSEEARLLPFLQALQELEYQPLVIESIALQKPLPVSPIPPSPTPTNPTPTDVMTNLTVFTNTASNITTDSAALHGNLALMGKYTDVVVQFEYGTTTSYGAKTSTQVMNDVGTFNDTITGLMPGTTYHYRAIAIGATNILQYLIKNGNDMTFMTVMPPTPTPTTMLKMTLTLAVYAQ